MPRINAGWRRVVVTTLAATLGVTAAARAGGAHADPAPRFTAATEEVATEEAATEEVDNRTGQRVAIAVAVALVVVSYVMNAALPASPFTLPGPKAETVRTLLPQGWAFFTKSPRSRSAEVYQHAADGGWRNITAGPRQRAGDLMGLNRLGRSQGTELAMLLALAPPEDWRDCERAPTACLAEATATRTLPNRSTHQSICGEVGVVLQDVLPWAWRDAPTTMPSKVLRVRVTC